MDKNAVQRFKDIIGKSNSIGIAVGQNPSIDEMGAALGLYLLLKTANKRVSVASPTDPIVEISNLVGIDKVQRHFGGDAGDLIVSFPYKEGEIEKVSYTLENNFLNIIVKASEQGLSFEEQDVRYTRGSGSIDLLIVVGAGSLDQIGNVVDSQKLRNISIVNIDIDPNNQGYGDVVLLNTQASTLSEHIGDIALIAGFVIDQDAAQNMLSGIINATRNFQDPKTSSLAFEIASILMKQGAKRSTNQFASNAQSNVQRPAMSANAQSGLPQRPPMPRPQQTTQPVTQPQSARPPLQSVQQPRPTAVPNNYNQPAQQPVQQPAQPPRNASMPNNVDQAEQPEEQNEKPPLDWLTPKVYKGSSEV